jgi:hypothetical protein
MRRMMASLLALVVFTGVPALAEEKAGAGGLKVEAGVEGGWLDNSLWSTYTYGPYLKLSRFGDSSMCEARVRGLFTSDKEVDDPAGRITKSMDGWDARGLVGLSDTQEGLTGTLLGGASWHSFTLEVESGGVTSKANLDVLAVELGGRVSGKLSDRVTLAGYGTVGPIVYGTYEVDVAGIKDHADTNNGFVAEMGLTLDWQLSRHWGLQFGVVYELLRTEPELGPEPTREAITLSRGVGQLGLSFRF